MGIDTYVLLRVRDRRAMREALEAYAIADRREWADKGREDEYEELLRDGYDPLPLMRPLDDGSVAIFTGHRYRERNADFTIRSWLAKIFGDSLSRFHDDPRGVFIYPDVTEPRSRTYDGIVAELEKGGRFVDPAPPTAAERLEREREMEEFIEGMELVEEAAATGDPMTLQRALASVPRHVKDAWDEQQAHTQRMQSMMARLRGGFPQIGDVAMHDGEQPPEVSEAIRHFQEQLGVLSTCGAVSDSTPEGLADIFAQLMETGEVEAAALGPGGVGRVSVLAPRQIIATLDGRTHIDVVERRPLADGSEILVSSRIDDASEIIAMDLARALDRAGVDRAALGPIPFFRESLVDELADAPDFDVACERLGDRATMLALRTIEERMRDERANVKTWLNE